MLNKFNDVQRRSDRINDLIDEKFSKGGFTIQQHRFAKNYIERNSYLDTLQGDNAEYVLDRIVEIHKKVDNEK